MSDSAVVDHRGGPEHARALPGLLRWCGHVVGWLVILGVLAVLAVAVVVPRLAGGTPYTILTGSMVPRYPPGTLVVDRPADPDRIGVGSIVTYQLHSGQPEVVTHRVVAVRSDLTGQVSYQTQGDANPVPDAAWVRPVQVRGQLWYAVPYLGRLNVLVGRGTHQLLTDAAAGGLGIYALVMFGGAVRDRRRRALA